MKQISKKFLSILFALCMISSTIHVSALTESSNYSDGYRAITTAESGGKLSLLSMSPVLVTRRKLEQLILLSMNPATTNFSSR